MTNYKQYYLYPSTLFASREPYQIKTILGSCVAVCLWDATRKIGGMNHYMLPLWNGKGLASPKYGNIAMEKLIAKMLQLGSKKNNLQAKVFGGAEVIVQQKSNYNIGMRNVLTAYDILRENNIPIISQSVKGQLGRKIIFLTDTGEVYHKVLTKTQNVK